MNARIAVEVLGGSLVGKFVTTEPVGSYIGGRAKVVELNPDPAAPEIVMTVRHPSWTHEGTDNQELKESVSRMMRGARG